MNASTTTDRDRTLAKVSENCLVCNLARRKQAGFAFWLVKKVEGRICPFCRAYERVFGRKSHEPAPKGGKTNLGACGNTEEASKSGRE